MRRPCLRLRLSSEKQDGVQTTRQCGRVCDRTFIGRVGWRARPAGGGWERWPLAAHACADGQGNGRQTARNAGCCRRDARRERQDASGRFAKRFTGEILYSLSASSSLSVTRLRFPRPLRRESPNGKPFESAPRCLRRGTRRAFSFAEAERTLSLDDRPFRASPSQTPSTEPSARYNANRFQELSTALTPSNMEGGTERRLLREPNGHGVFVSVRTRAQRRGSALEDAVRSDQRSRSRYAAAVQDCRFVCEAIDLRVSRTTCVMTLSRLVAI